jgi:hypothetical protein
MPSGTRRDALYGAVTLLAGVAGCAGESSSGAEYPPESVDNVELAPESYSLRTPAPGPAFWTGERPTPGTGERRAPGRHHRFVTSADEADAVSFAAVSGAAGASDFLAATDYDTATVYAEQRTVEACFAAELCHIRWSEDDVHTGYVRRYREADVSCEADAEDVVATLIRVPERIDPSAIDGYGSSYGSGTCEERTRRLRRLHNESRSSG